MLMRAFTIVSLALLGACDVLSRHNGGAARRARPATAKTGVIAGVDAPVLEVRASQAETGKAVDAGDREQKLYIELFNDRNFQGRSVSYGPHKRCDTLDIFGRYTDSRTPWSSAKITVDGGCCLLYPSFGCKGPSTLLGGEVPDLGTYGVGNQLRSVYCMPRKNCDEYYTQGKYQG